MNKQLILIILIFTMISCQKNSDKNSQIVSNTEELVSAIENATPGSEIIMKDGIWKNIEIRFSANGTKNKPITLRAETAGKVFIEGISNLKFGGDYLKVSGLYFKNGHTPSGSVIGFRITKDKVANHCTFSNCAIEYFNQPHRNISDHWIEFWGRHNQLDHCYITGKSNWGPTVRVKISGNRSIKNYHKIINNNFGPRPRMGGPHGETIQIGDSFTSMSPSNTIVANNLFDSCNGEVEIISCKSNFNEIRNNVFYHSEGSLVLRHGNYDIIDGNYFIGDGVSESYGGIRLVNTGHWITNNYFYNLKGKNFRSPLAVMNGIPKSPLNRYNQVTDVVVAYNTWINCTSPWQFGVGTNISQKGVLPLSEIRSARPIRTLVANNIIYNQESDLSPIVAHDNIIDGVNFESNIINNQNGEYTHYKGLDDSPINMEKLNENIFIPATNSENIKPYKGFEFENITKDIFGNLRNDKTIGAICQAPNTTPNILNKKQYGCNWYANTKNEQAKQTLIASNKNGELSAKIALAKDGDIIALLPGQYNLPESLIIDKKITIQSKDTNKKVQITYTGSKKTPAFEMNPKGNLSLNNIILTGQMDQFAFASLKTNMSSAYGLSIKGCEISNFDYVLKAYKESFAEEISFQNNSFSNCSNGIDLSEETEDKGFYNVEYLSIDNCQFNRIQSNVIDYYRGGYDESTLGGHLSVNNCTFTDCGQKDKNGILLNTHGIWNVDISGNTLKNNPVKMVALLWGAKNNTHSNNKITNSGKIVVEENLKLKTFY